MADQDRAAYLAHLAKVNPYRFFTFKETAEMFGFSRDAITAMVNAGAPHAAKKINPSALSEWLKSNSDKVGKINPEAPQYKTLGESRPHSAPLG